ncbi:transglutaminase-like domain-containing protein [Mangrovimonas sp. AS39]|uniref:transglutaminase-like domain-containing protein n=1 Tax=Mangrovimonas futianensis TaxID=2895523 RepID=UPI001E57C2ED|nr:transglutaminase-like domain-containing protein [Mangrovimonas futianensis]MCF1191214.1 transglutaminase-like domain-containing protein [Mangrovimonas futianensis]MCF1194909.1 transglutaminase-like domain-containing protein [Mangrovimonas futianensis]
MKFRKKIIWYFKRHPMLYLTRFRLLSRNSRPEDLSAYSFNRLNKKEAIPSFFYDINDVIFFGGKMSTDLDNVKKLAIWLHSHIPGGPGLSEPSDRALKLMLKGQGGVCSDMAQIFNNFCVINDLQVREWGTTRAPFDLSYGGHAFNEVFCKELNQWVLVDVYHTLLFFDDNNQSLSTMGLFERLRQGLKVQHEVFGVHGRFEAGSVERNFLHPHTVPFLICDYSNRTYDWFLKRFRNVVPVFAIHFIVFLLGKGYHYRFPMDNYNTVLSS